MAASSAAPRLKRRPAPVAARIAKPAVESADWAPDESLEWIVALAEPYLRGYIPRAERGGALAGYRFLAPGLAEGRGSKSAGKRRTSRPATGFFVGYLLDAAGFAYLRAAPPECLVYWFVEPVGGALHRRLAEPQGLAPRTAEYVRWLTHRPPRFELFAREPITLVRHDSMRDWPREKVQHLSRNFFIETLAWLVRSALVRRLPLELAAGSAKASETH